MRVERGDSGEVIVTTEPTNDKDDLDLILGIDSVLSHAGSIAAGEQQERTQHVRMQIVGLSRGLFAQEAVSDRVAFSPDEAKILSAVCREPEVMPLGCNIQRVRELGSLVQSALDPEF